MSFVLSSESPYAESKRRMAHSCVKQGANVILLGGYMVRMQHDAYASLDDRNCGFREYT